MRLFFLGCLLATTSLFAQNFKAEQSKHAKVKTAYAEKWNTLKNELTKQGINSASFTVFFRAFKQEQEFEVWVKNKNQSTYQLFKKYNICASSGELGPKRKEGDGQVPEGFYNINIFNPFSNYYLSLGINYPNASDKYFSDKKRPGGAIMIHGNCVTIGCIPLTDDIIKEVYVLAVEAKNNGQTIPVHIFPFRMTEKNYNAYTNDASYASAKSFWKNLQPGYDYFEQKKINPAVSVDKQGNYVFK